MSLTLASSANNNKSSVASTTSVLSVWTTGEMEKAGKQVSAGEVPHWTVRFDGCAFMTRVD